MEVYSSSRHTWEVVYKGHIASMGINREVHCCLCGNTDESISHIFFVCSVAAEVWANLLKWQGIQRPPKGWSEEIRWVIINAKGKNAE
ncbi:hypothetical protein KY290_010429 [Solanum tuberosum]|uniref:Reverse transcriptase zinc-binding domain-containing protein n=1 Tax=Solanum tuberosum TaxID=4113 RepID=A0ABQ7VXR2_SOLTU|nr:hypothetical protein KY290_010429 [Solanum tuberosum]